MIEKRNGESRRATAGSRGAGRSAGNGACVSQCEAETYMWLAWNRYLWNIHVS